MEGISQEAIALAGHLKLNKLIVLFDDNGISIDGPLSLADSVDQVKRFEAAGWAASRIDGHDPEAIAARDRGGADLRPADADRLPHHHRLRRADQGRHVEVPRLAARRRRDQGRARKARLAGRRLRGAGRRARRSGARPACAAAARAAAWQQRLTALPRRQARRVRAPHRAASCRRTSSPPPCARVKDKLAADAEGDRHPRSLGDRARSADRRRCRKWSAAPPTSPAPTTPAPRA